MNEDFIYEFSIPEYICEGLIEYNKENTEYKKQGTSYDNKGGSVVNKDIKDSIDVNFYNSSKHPIVIDYFNHLTKGLNNYVKKYGLGSYHTYVSNLIQCYPPGGGFKVWHHERANVNVLDRGLVYMTYLNNIYDKGETEFKYQQTKFKPRTGLSLIWPSDFTHVHRGIPSPTQIKYIATGWFINT